MYFLGSHPTVLKKIENESMLAPLDVDSFFSGSQFKYLESAIKETLRLKPGVLFVDRFPFQDIQVGNFTIPKGKSSLLSEYDSAC